MKTMAYFGITAVLLAASTVSMANKDLATRQGCMACHGIEKKLVGPSYQDVAAKYAKDPKAEAMLIDKVIKGGKGTWGQIPMPANPNTKEAEVKTLVKWVLGGAK